MSLVSRFPRNLAAEEPVDDAKIRGRHKDAEAPPDNANTQRMGACESASDCNVLTPSSHRGKQRGKEAGGSSSEHSGEIEARRKKRDQGGVSSKGNEQARKADDDSNWRYKRDWMREIVLE